MVRALAHRQRALIVLAFFLGTWLLGSVYAYASPVGTSPDEPDHWSYAYALHTGQDASDGLLEVPYSLAVNPSACIAWRPDLNAKCVPIITENRDVVTVRTALTGAPELYYQLIGWPLTQWPDERGILISRVISALVSALLWTVAVLPWTDRRSWLVRLAVIMSVAPAALYFSGTVQPSGMEIAAFAALWSLGFVVFRRLRRAPYHSLPAWIQVAWPALIMLTIFIRMASAWFVAVVLLVVWIWSAVPIRELLRDRRMMVAALFVLGAAALRALSFVMERGSDVIGDTDLPPADRSPIRMVISTIMRLSGEPDRAIGLLGWMDTHVPSMGTVYWFLIAGGIVFLAAPFVRRRELVTIAALFGLLAATAFALDIGVQKATGRGMWQPRYGFPIWLGAPILMAAIHAAATARRRVDFVPVLRWGCALGLVAMHVLSVGFLMARYMYGITGGGIGRLGWTPYAPTTLVTGIVILAAILIGLAVLLPGSGRSTAERRMAENPPAEPAA